MHTDLMSAQINFLGAWRTYLPFNWTAGERWSRNVTEHVLLYVWEGSGFLTADLKEKHVLAPGGVYWLRPGRKYLMEQRGRKRLGVVFVHFDIRNAKGQQMRHGDPLPPLELPKSMWPFVNEATHKLVEFSEYELWSGLPIKRFASQYKTGRHYRQNPGKAARPGGLMGAARYSRLARARLATPVEWNRTARALLRVLLMDLATGAELPQDRYRRTAKMSQREFAAQDLSRQIHCCPGEIPKIPKLAKQAGLGYQQLYRDFAQEVGMSPLRYTRFARMYQALHLLRTSTQSIEEIRKVLGYDSHPFFTQHFIELTGMTPRTFRKRADMLGKGLRLDKGGAKPSVRARMKKGKKKSAKKAHAKTQRRKKRK
ncbi:MAG: helix-turn-helix domain-containing protein [Bacteroidetes bacterium]|nr:helix-turn-helix domain-containing protein [Bacteroidota bacterium]